MLIAIIGVDLAGKSTQTALLRAYYASCRRLATVVSLKEKPTVATVLLLSHAVDPLPTCYPFGLPADYYAMAYNIDFLNHFVNNIQPLLVDHAHLVISDRYTPCYKAFARAVGAVESFSHHFLDVLPEPDLTIHLRVPVTVALYRMASRDSPPTPDETPEILSRLLDYYDEYCRQHADVSIVDGTQSALAVRDEIVSAAHAHLGL